MKKEMQTKRRWFTWWLCHRRQNCCVKLADGGGGGSWCAVKLFISGSFWYFTLFPFTIYQNFGWFRISRSSKAPSSTQSVCCSSLIHTINFNQSLNIVGKCVWFIIECAPAYIDIHNSDDSSSLSYVGCKQMKKKKKKKQTVKNQNKKQRQIKVCIRRKSVVWLYLNGIARARDLSHFMRLKGITSE